MLGKVGICHEVEAEKLDADKRLAEVREVKEVLLQIHQDLQDAIKAEQNTQLKAAIVPKHLAQLQQLLDQAIET